MLDELAGLSPPELETLMVHAIEGGGVVDTLAYFIVLGALVFWLIGKWQARSERKRAS